MLTWVLVIIVVVITFFIVVVAVFNLVLLINEYDYGIANTAVLPGIVLEKEITPGMGSWCSVDGREIYISHDVNYKLRIQVLNENRWLFVSNYTYANYDKGDLVTVRGGRSRLTRRFFIAHVIG